MYCNVLAADGNTKTCEPCMGNKREEVQRSCAANNDLISHLPDNSWPTDLFSQCRQELEQDSQHLKEILDIADTRKGLDNENQEFLSEL